MAKPKPTATSLDALTGARAMQVSFHPGQTAAGHHWDVHGDDGTVLARTRRVHQGGALKRAMWKTVTLTGMDNGNDVHSELLGADDTVLLRASALSSRPPTVTITDANGLTLCESTNADRTLTIRDAAGHVAAAVAHEDDPPWIVRDATGAELGRLVAGTQGPSTTQSYVEEIFFPLNLANESSDFARTMHLGMRRVLSYGFARATQSSPGASPLAVALVPLLAGLTY